MCCYTLGLLQVLQQLQSADATVRGKAEELLNSSPLLQLLPALAAAAGAPEAEEGCRQLAAVLVRRCIHTRLKEVSVNQEEKQQVLLEVLQRVVGAIWGSSPASVRKAAAEAIGEVWRNLPLQGGAC